MTGALALNGIGCEYGNNPLGESLFSNGVLNTVDQSVFYNTAATNPMFGGMGYPMYDSYGMYGGMGIPYAGSSLMPSDYANLANKTPEERTRYLAELEEQQIEYSERRSELSEDKMYERSIKRVQRQNGIESAERAARDAAVKLCDVIRMNRKDEVLSCFNELKNQVAKMPQCQKLVKGTDGVHVAVPLDNKELTAYARDFYKQVTGLDLVAQIQDELSGSFTHGLKTGLLFGICGDGEDADTLTENIMGLKRDGENRAARATGRALGGATTGVAAGAGIGTCICPGPGSAIGAVVGGVVGLVAGLFSSIF